MSVKVMSAIFETEFTDLKDAEGHVTKGSTVKLVLLALADHANDEGEGAYPGLTRMQLKTALSRQGILNVYDALLYHGVLRQDGISRLGTNQYAIMVDKLRTLSCDPTASPVNPVATGCPPDVPVVNPVATGWQPDVPVVNPIAGVVNPVAEVVNPVDPNHPLNINKPSNDDEEQKDAENYLRRLYEDNLGKVTPLLVDLLRNAALTYPRVWFQPAFETAARNKARSWKYIETILEGWRIHGFGSKPERFTRSDPQDAYRARQERNREVIESLVEEELKHGR